MSRSTHKLFLTHSIQGTQLGFLHNDYVLNSPIVVGGAPFYCARTAYHASKLAFCLKFYFRQTSFYFQGALHQLSQLRPFLVADVVNSHPYVKRAIQDDSNRASWARNRASLMHFVQTMKYINNRELIAGLASLSGKCIIAVPEPGEAYSQCWERFPQAENSRLSGSNALGHSITNLANNFAELYATSAVSLDIPPQFFIPPDYSSQTSVDYYDTEFHEQSNGSLDLSDSTLRSSIDDDLF